MKKIYQMTMDEVIRRINTRLPKKGIAFGVPRGGATVAAIMAGMGRKTTQNPECADFIVDDIIDSGKTFKRWKSWFPELPFCALVDSNVDKGLGWIQFPWEHEAKRDVEDNVVRLLEYIGEDPNREGLRDTPKRVVKAWGEMTSGYQIDPKTVLGTNFEGEGYDQLILCRGIEFTSLCEHHMLGFSGVAHVAYIPSKRVVGLSKMARLVDCFARRLQIQERLTQQVARTMHEVLKPKGVGVMFVAKHSCMSCRGVMKQQSEMVTTSLMGCFREHKVKEEFLIQCR